MGMRQFLLGLLVLGVSIFYLYSSQRQRESLYWWQKPRAVRAFILFVGGILGVICGIIWIIGGLREGLK
jgi:uncharacterized membrane protein YfcA